MLSRSSQPNLIEPGTETLGLRFWMLLLAAGIAAGLLMKLLRWVQHTAWTYRTGDFLQATARASPWHIVLVLTGGGLFAGLARRWLRQHVGGHGGEIAEAIWRQDGKVPLVPTLLRAALSIISVGLGAALGREGAPKQAGAAFASFFAGWMRLPLDQRRLLAACGAGAGMAAVYNVPFGGALFALEVLLGSLMLPLVLPALACAGLATATFWLLVPRQVAYDVTWAGAPPPVLLLGAALAGPVIGLAAAGYVRAVGWADRRVPGGWAQIVAPTMVLGALGVAAIGFPQLLGNGRGVTAQALAGTVPALLLVAVLPLRVLATTMCLASGTPGGLFMPTITVGALLGGVLGHGWAPAGTMALIGATAFLAAATDGPISAVALILELTRRIDPMVVPMLVATAGALLAARALQTRSIYSVRLVP